MTHKSKITPASSLLFCSPLPTKTHTTSNINATFSNCIIFNFTENSLVVLIPYKFAYLFTGSQQCFVTTLLRHTAFNYA